MRHSVHGFFIVVLFLFFYRMKNFWIRSFEINETQCSCVFHCCFILVFLSLEKVLYSIFLNFTIQDVTMINSRSIPSSFSQSSTDLDRCVFKKHSRECLKKSIYSFGRITPTSSLRLLGHFSTSFMPTSTWLIRSVNNLILEYSIKSFRDVK